MSEENAVMDSEEETVDEIRVAFDDAIAADKSEDEVKMAMIGAGATFKNVTRLFNQYMIDAGLAVSKEEKDEIVANVLDDGDLDLSTEEGFSSAIDAIVEQATGITEKSAASLVRAWGKKNEVEVYKKPKGEGTGRVGFASAYYDALVANPSMTKDEAHDIIHNHELSSNNVKNHESHYQAIRQLANNIAAA